MTQVNIKRVYDEPSEQDGYRVLVDRLWPRGMKREYLKYDYFYMEKPKIIPYWLARNSDKDFYNEILKTKTDRHIRELYKITEYEIFNVDVKNNKLEQKKLLFKYDKNRVVEEIN